VPGTQVTFTGSGFGSSQGSGVVWLGSTTNHAVQAVPVCSALFVTLPNLFKSSVGIIVAFDIDEWNAEGRAGAADTKSMATMLLHEMGHVYNYLIPQGSGGSRIIQNDSSGTQSQDNDQLIFRTCFP